jgi:hypothetical protein
VSPTLHKQRLLMEQDLCPSMHAWHTPAGLSLASPHCIHCLKLQPKYIMILVHSSWYTGPTEINTHNIVEFAKVSREESQST